MLRKQYRLLTRLPAHSSRIYKIPYFTVRVSKNNVSVSRFGFVVSLKVSKKATLRNKARRRLSEAIKSQEKNIKPGIDAVIIALPGIEKKEFSEIKKAVTDMLTKTKLNV